MNEDIDIKNDKVHFKFRVSAIIIKNNMILLTKSINNEGYRFPGGHVKIGESTEEAIVREVKEEVGLSVKVKNLYSVLELIYKDKKSSKIYQEINYYYVIESSEFKNFDDFEINEVDNGEEKCHKYKWFNLCEIDKINLKPEKMAEYLKNNINSKNNIIYYNDKL